MSAAASSSSSEITGKPHPYQCENKRGAPRGAFEARRARRGLYVRVDMPGVPDDGVKVVKYNDTRTVTFSGKTPPPPPRWLGFESESDTRVYGGYVALDRDLADVEFESHKNGCLRLFFPRCDGSLHFLSPPDDKPSVPLHIFVEGGEVECDCPLYMSFIAHDDSDQSASASGVRLAGGAPEDINPYQLSGVRGVSTHEVAIVEGGDSGDLLSGDQLIYIRLDVPDTCEKTSVVLETNGTYKEVVYGATASKNEYYSRFDEAGREYSGSIIPNCECCNYSVLRFENENGVLRLLFRKSDDNSDPKPVFHCLVTPEMQARHWHPSSLYVPEHVPGALKLRARNRSTRPVCKNPDAVPVVHCHMNPSRRSGDLHSSSIIIEHVPAAVKIAPRNQKLRPVRNS